MIRRYKDWKKRITSLPVKEVKAIPKVLGGYSPAGLCDRIFDSKGRLIKNRIYVRSDLPKRVKKHVKIHEQVHAVYPQFGEIRTNIVSFVLDPVGWFFTAKRAVTNKQTRKYYLGNVKNFFGFKR